MIMKFDKNTLLSKYNEFTNNKKQLENLINKAKHDTDHVLHLLNDILIYIDLNCDYFDNIVYDKVKTVIDFILDNKNEN